MADSSKQQTLPEETSSRQNERIKILRKGKLCYGCLKPMAKDHNAKNWQQWLSGRICTACHPTMLHGYIPKVKTDNSQSQNKTKTFDSYLNKQSEKSYFLSPRSPEDFQALLSILKVHKAVRPGSIPKIKNILVYVEYHANGLKIFSHDKINVFPSKILYQKLSLMIMMYHKAQF